MTRRTALKLSALSLSTTATTGLATATTTDDPREKAKTLFQKQETSKAVEILEDAGIPHKHAEHSVPISDDPSAADSTNDEDGISTQDFFTNPESNKISTLLYETYTDGVWHLSTGWNLTRNSDFDGPEPTDALILAWDDSHFKYDPNSLDYEVTHEYDMPSGTVTHTDGHTLEGGKYVDYMEVSNGPLIGDYNNGIGFRIFDHAQESTGVSVYWPQRQYGHANIEIERQADGPANVQTRFEHTWSIGNVSQFDPIFNTSISKNASSVDITIPVEADSWNKDALKEIPDNT
ncbi:hypothetical protein CP557_19185 [Natrinema ejinorense]|uniref:Uncharacterized protein n=1 Tax=Natrinema ejinorense TaxID=373386 RepID=A0A2A5R023_9EURY|nr:hypothetical protein CP557_19185 [Natrinema ejinorense]